MASSGSRKTALVIGGTGPTGPFVVSGLLDRGYDVAILHRGTHEVPEIPPEVEHIHTDPFSREDVEAALEGRSFALTIVSYGRLRMLADLLSGRTGRFVSIGGAPAYRGYMNPAAYSPAGMPVPVREDALLVESSAESHN